MIPAHHRGAIATDPLCHQPIRGFTDNSEKRTVHGFIRRVTVHGPGVTSVQRGTESRAIAGGPDFAGEWLEHEADAEPKGDHRAGADTRDARLSGTVRWTKSSTD
jgi:hypothetical protein